VLAALALVVFGAYDSYPYISTDSAYGISRGVASANNPPVETA